MALISIETERKIADLLMLYAEGEQEIEKARINLCDNREFEPLSCFKQLDRCSNGYLNFIDFRDFFDKKRINVSDKDIHQLIRQYDSDSDARLLISDFQQLVLPSTNIYLRDTAVKRSAYLHISQDVEYLLIRLLEKEAVFQHKLESLKYGLVMRSDYKNLDGFRCIDFRSESYLTRDNLIDFFRRHAMAVYEDDIDALLRRLDTDGDEMLSYSEFVDAVQPAEITYEAPSRRVMQSSARHSSPLRRSFSPSRSLTKSHYESSFERSATKESDELEISHVLKQQIDLSRDLDAAIKELALRADFNLIDAYRIFDYSDRGYVNEVDFEDGLRDLGIRIIRDEITLLFKHFSPSQNRHIRFSEFNELFEPKDPEYARLVKNRVPFNLQEDERRRPFRPETMSKFTRVLHLHLECESIAENLRQKLSRNLNFDIMGAFQSIDKDKNGFITVYEFQQILENNGIPVSRRDAASLVERYDKDKDGRVSYSEFLNEFTPKSPQKH